METQRLAVLSSGDGKDQEASLKKILLTYSYSNV